MIGVLVQYDVCSVVCEQFHAGYSPIALLHNYLSLHCALICSKLWPLQPVQFVFLMISLEHLSDVSERLTASKRDLLLMKSRLDQTIERAILQNRFSICKST